MRFKKGDKVEVLTQREVPSGSWRCAEIIGGNGSTYAVKYEGDVELLGKGIVERVPRKAIRPCPPSVDVLQNWVSGDVLEVFHNFSWKMGTILKVLRLNCLLVRLLGSTIELKMSKFDVRARLCWQDGEWILIGKASNKCEDMRFRIPSSRKDNNNQIPKIDSTVSRPMKGHRVGTRITRNAVDPNAVPSRILKRKQPDLYSQVEANVEPKRKFRMEKREEVWHHQQPQLPEKVDDVAFPQELVHEKCLHPSFVNKVAGCSELISEREKPDAIIIESDDENSVASSVASCSVFGNYSHKLHFNVSRGPSGDIGSEHSDAESFCLLNPKKENANFLPSKEKLTEEIHRIELHAYRRTIGALHASGPLSWDQELLLTNLRHSLHISNDEHLKEIRNLVSSST